MSIRSIIENMHQTIEKIYHIYQRYLKNKEYYDFSRNRRIISPIVLYTSQKACKNAMIFEERIKAYALFHINHNLLSLEQRLPIDERKIVESIMVSILEYSKHLKNPLKLDDSGHKKVIETAFLYLSRESDLFNPFNSPLYAADDYYSTLQSKTKETNTKPYYPEPWTKQKNLKKLVGHGRSD